MDIQTLSISASAGSSEEKTPCLQIIGRFDAFETPQFKAVIDELLDNDHRSITVDLAQVEFVDSSALAELVRVHKRLRELGGELVLVNPSDPVVVIFELTRLDSAFRIERTSPAVEIG